jgi:hypothetical protein
MHPDDALRLSNARIRELHQEAAAHNLAHAARLARKAASRRRAGDAGRDRRSGLSRLGRWTIASWFTPFRRAIP